MLVGTIFFSRYHCVSYFCRIKRFIHCIYCCTETWLPDVFGKNGHILTFASISVGRQFAPKQRPIKTLSSSSVEWSEFLPGASDSWPVKFSWTEVLAPPGDPAWQKTNVLNNLPSCRRLASQSAGSSALLCIISLLSPASFVPLLARCFSTGGS